ncbi:MAG: TVP38/TMEM64 family protein [Alphaproteobacteria bacterium]|nr:MAG: TVP38/TMEM64 family protein [Alphaproteobacteria bacterium]
MRREDNRNSMNELVETDRGSPVRPAAAGWRYLPLLLLLAVVVALSFSDAGAYVNHEWLSENLDRMREFVHAHPLVSLLLLILAYSAGTAVSFPAMAMISVAAGAIYGLWLGTLGVVIGATIGATIVFFIARSSLGVTLRRRAGPWLRRFQAGIRRDEFHFLLALRLVPVVPFWVLNIVPGLVGMRLRNYVWATLLGIIPGSFVYVWVGTGAAHTLRMGGDVSPRELILQPHVLGPLVGLALLALLPVIVRRLRPDLALPVDSTGE